jgi:hypothetical protein
MFGTSKLAETDGPEPCAAYLVWSTDISVAGHLTNNALSGSLCSASDITT